MLTTGQQAKVNYGRDPVFDLTAQAQVQVATNPIGSHAAKPCQCAAKKKSPPHCAAKSP
jgi:hypothetical protein